MSGGVDSSVTAKLLADKDFDLSAVFMRNWDSRDEKASDIGCEWEKDWEDVQRVCKMLDIPHRMVDLSRDYWNRVFEPSLRAWESGVTPNPDIWCNKEIKFGSLLEHLPTDTQFVATGHYARKEYDPKTGRPKLLRCADPTKDQTYFLSSISEHGLNKALFPLADLTKTRIREIAHAAGLPTASRAESMGICFVGEKRRFSEFLSDYFPPRPGPICDLGTGRVLAEHTGLWTLTIGQNARVPGMPERMFVVSKDMSSNTIWVSTGASPALRVPSITCSDFAWIWADAPPAGVDSPQGFRASVKVRHKMGHTPCTVFRESSGGVRILFDEPEKGVAEGQVAVLWDGDWCLGCGTINGMEHAAPTLPNIESILSSQTDSHHRDMRFAPLSL
ncbi:5-methylaminomethyl-2-thiouridylate-methyltransferase [Peniophora sp. CONT]|nr:5-methylaminomethyl-2-thiouridylate-methyltransferase [Peniophora sp. CONT]